MLVSISPGLFEKLENIPTSPGIYQYYDEKAQIIYVGKAKNLKNRVKSYFQQNRPRDAKTVSLVNHIVDVKFVVTDSEMEALILENNLIKEFKPKYNVSLKDDKTYPYIVVTKEQFPRVFITRKRIKGGGVYFGPYTNVLTMKQALKMVKDLFMVRSCQLPLTVENISQKKWKVCLDYHIKKCMGPCEAFQSQSEYEQMIHQVVQLINGKTKTLKSILKEEMERKADDMEFEAAAILRDRLHSLEVYTAKQKAVSDDFSDRDMIGFSFLGSDAACVIFQIRDGKMAGSHHFYLERMDEELQHDQVESFLFNYYQRVPFFPDEIYLNEIKDENFYALEASIRKIADKKITIIYPKIGDKHKLLELAEKNAEHLLSDLLLQKQKKFEDFIPHAVKALQRDLRLPSLPRRIECFDNSNIQGSDPVSSMVCFVDGKPLKSDYRKFAVENVSGPDDFETMKEVVHRRYSGSLSELLPLPDLIVIDGGKGQLSHAVEAIKGTKAEKIPIIGLAKKLEEVFFPNDKDPYNLPKTSSSLKLLQQARDEAHRFAITYHREKRSKRTLTTELENIPTLGKVKINLLLKEIGSVTAIKDASDVQLIPLIGHKSTQAIREYFSGIFVTEQGKGTDESST